MFLFRHALQLCTISCFSVAVEGRVLFALNIEDFNNLANQFLSTNVARRLTRLVSENTGAIRRDDTNGGVVSSIDLNKIAELIRDRILTKHTTTVSTTKKTRTQASNKRFNTVKNTVDTTEFPKTTKRIQNIRRDPNFKTSPGLVYVRDDLDTLFQNYNEPSNNYDSKKHDHYETRPNESEEEIVPQEPSTKGSIDVKRNTQQHDDTNKKMDNTEAKLGEWLYNHIIAEKPMKPQNHKTRNGDINDEGNSDELPDESKPVQYVYPLLEKDKSKQNIGNNFNHQDQQKDGKKDYVMGPKKKTIYKNTPQKQLIEKNLKIENEVIDMLDYVKLIAGNKNTFNQESTGPGPEQLPFEQGTINESIMRPQLNTNYKKKTHKQIIEDHQEIDNEVMDKRDSVKSVTGYKNTFNQESFRFGYDQQADEQGAINESIMRPPLNTIYKQKPQKQEIEENYMSSQTKDQEIENFSSMVTPEYGRIKKIQENKNTFNNKHTDLDKGVGRMPADLEESNPEPNKSKIESLLFTEDGEQQPIEKHILYDKYVLGSKDKENNQKTPQIQSVRDNYELSKEIKRVDPKQVDKSDETLSKEIDDLFNEIEEEASAYSTPDIKKTKKKVPLRHKEAKSDSDKKIKSTLHDTVEVKIQEDSKQENNILRKRPQKHSMEENDMRETYASSSEAKNKKHTDIKPLLEDDYEKSKKESKHLYDAVSDKDEEFGNKKHTLKNTKGNDDTVVKQRLGKKAPMNNQKYVKYLPDFESAKLGSSSNEIKEKQVKEHETTNNYKLGKRKETSKQNSREEDEKYDNKYNKRPQKHHIEENDTHEKSSSETKNKKGDRYDNKFNKYQHKETFKKQVNDKYDTKYKKRPQKYSIEDKDMHEKSSSETKNKKGDQYDNKYNKYQHEETFNKQEDDKYDTKYKKIPQKHSIEDNDMHEKSSSETKNKKGDQYDNKYNKYQHNETFNKQEDDKYDTEYKKRPQKHSIEDNDMHEKSSSETKNKKGDRYDNKYNKYQHKETFKKQEDDKYDTKYKKRPQKHSIEDNDMHEKSSSETKNKKGDWYDNKYNKYQNDETSKKQSMEENKTYEKETPDSKSNDKSQFKKQPIEENSIYEIYELGSKHKSKDRENDKDGNGHEESVVGKRNKPNQGRNIDKDDDNGREEIDTGKRNKFNNGRNQDDNDNNDELLLKNKNRHILKATTKVNKPKHEENQEKRPLEGYADDPRPDFKEVKPENIKGNIYSILESDERKGKPTKRFVMKGTLIPKREFYKLSSPDYYKDLPRNVDKYDFSEPIPERDRQRDEVRYLKREPARLNRKIKLPKFERVK